VGSLARTLGTRPIRRRGSVSPARVQAAGAGRARQGETRC